MRIWTDEERDIVKELRENSTYQEISNALYNFGYEDRSAESIRCMLKRERLANQSSSDNLELDLGDTTTSAIEELDKAIEEVVITECSFEPVYNEEVAEELLEGLNKIDELRALLAGVTRQHFVTKGRTKETTTKVLCLSDLHIPFHNSSVIADAIINHSDADVLVLNGDILDLFAVSRFMKNKEVLLRHEYKVGLEMVKMFSEMFPKVYITHGNHEERLKYHMATQLNPTVSFLVNEDILDRLANGEDVNSEGKLEKRYDFDNVFYEGGPLKWYVQIGQTIFAHPSHFSSVPMKTACNAADTLSMKEEFQCLVLGHTHKMGSVIAGGKLLIEQGCCTVPMDYEASAKARYSPQSFGYAVIYMDEEGNVDFNKSRPIYYGSECVNKKYLKEAKK